MSNNIPGNHFQHTRVIVVVHSHQAIVGSGVVDCSFDVTELQTSKTIKGSGGFSFKLVARKNYSNLIFPNDVVNIYIDPGDGERGFVRMMFGYVDRIGRDEKVNEQGQVTTTFTVTGSDFVKAIDKTEIYFNPAFAARQDLVGAFGQSQLGGGHALRTSGITAYGTPPQFVENLMQLLMGFGEQWVLPDSYTSNTTLLTESRKRRKQRAKGWLPADIVNQLKIGLGVTPDSIGLSDDIESQIVAKQTTLNQQSGLTDAAGNPSASVLNEQQTAQQAALSKLFSAKSQLQAYQTILRSSQDSSPFSLMDLLAFDFIEALSMDGFISDRTVWTNQGTLASFLYGWSNEIVNELCFDLRPVAESNGGQGDACFSSTSYSRDTDELGYNVHGTDLLPAGTPGVKYMPAVIMREYPHSVVEGLDLSKFAVLGSFAGFQAFGPVFSQAVQGSQRVIYTYQNALAPESCSYSDGGSPQKHLDVVQIQSSDTTGSSVARSDADLFNLFELYASAPRPELWKYLLSEIIPILTPVSIKRHGLRVRQLTTKFANYSRDQLCDGSSGIDTGTIRRNLIRWALLLDHWYQHNIEYMSGTINLRGMPEIRVGYRLDWTDRNESYYVESVQHQWAFGAPLQTTVQVSRGQRSDPYPAYIPPILAQTQAGVAPGAVTGNAQTATGQFDAVTGADQTTASLAGNQVTANNQVGPVQQAGGGDRSDTSRLGTFFGVKDTNASRRSVDLTGQPQQFGSDQFDDNYIDKPENVSGYAIFPGASARDASQSNDGLIDYLSTPNYDGNDGSPSPTNSQTAQKGAEEP